MKKLNFFLLAALAVPFAVSAQKSKVDTMAVVAGVTAHRGYSIAYPENTLASFQAGIDAHADWVELDIHKTKDGQIIVSHDATTKRTGDKDLVIANTTWDELKQVDVATDFRKRNGLTLEQCPVQHMPLLKDAIALIMKQKRTHLSIQPKADIVADAIAIVKAENAEKMVGFNDGSLKYMSDVKTLAPQIPVFWDRLPTTDVDDDIRVAKEKGFETIVVHYKGITSEKIGKIHAANLKAGAWTVDERADLENLEKMGIDRIYTDDPKLLITIKKELHK
nr:glycerophosphodiester phosphodiesterase family protein [Mucilaginibacter sp. L294]